MPQVLFFLLFSTIYVKIMNQQSDVTNIPTFFLLEQIKCVRVVKYSLGHRYFLYRYTNKFLKTQRDFLDSFFYIPSLTV